MFFCCRASGVGRCFSKKSRRRVSDGGTGGPRAPITHAPHPNNDTRRERAQMRVARGAGGRGTATHPWSNAGVDAGVASPPSRAAGAGVAPCLPYSFSQATGGSSTSTWWTPSRRRRRHHQNLRPPRSRWGRSATRCAARGPLRLWGLTWRARSRRCCHSPPRARTPRRRPWEQKGRGTGFWALCPPRARNVRRPSSSSGFGKEPRVAAFPPPSPRPLLCLVFKRYHYFGVAASAARACYPSACPREMLLCVCVCRHAAQTARQAGRGSPL